jgi:hypothetical protein
LLILRGGDTGWNDRAASAGRADASAGRPNPSSGGPGGPGAPAVSYATAAGDASAASSNASSAMAIGRYAVISGFGATACAPIHANGGCAFAVHRTAQACGDSAVWLGADGSNNTPTPRVAAVCVVTGACTCAAFWKRGGEAGASIGPVVHPAASTARHPAGSAPASTCGVVDGRRCCRIINGRRCYCVASAW